MKKITFDTGLEQFKLPGGVLRFNPADPNLYIRFMEAEQRLLCLEETLRTDADAMEEKETGKVILTLMQKADTELKNILSWVFGEENDFHKLLGGVNLLAEASNGRRVVENLFLALEPVLEEGICRCAAGQTQC